jgi:hypothetical protein
VPSTSRPQRDRTRLDSQGEPETPQGVADIAAGTRDVDELKWLYQITRQRGWFKDYVSSNPNDDAAPLDDLETVLEAARLRVT